MLAPRLLKKLRKCGNRATRMPGEVERLCQDAVQRREGRQLILDPAPPRSLLALLAELPDLDEDFGPIGDPAPAPIQL